MSMSQRGRSPDPGQLFATVAAMGTRKAQAAAEAPAGAANIGNPDRSKMRPKPAPCTAQGLALSGGGVRSAAVCLGALQALDHYELLEGVDYLSTVSGGGYAGSSLSAALSRKNPSFPFGGDVADSPAIAHLRNYSNYLMPRGRNSARNLAEPAVLILRGILANTVIVLTFLLLAAWASITVAALWKASALDPARWFMGALAVLLLAWAILRAYLQLDRLTDDTRGALLNVAQWLLIAVVVLLVLGLQPLALRGFQWLAATDHQVPLTFGGLMAGLSAAVTAFSGGIGRFLQASRRSSGFATVALRRLSQVAVTLAALVLPALLWVAYLWLWASGPSTGWLTGLAAHLRTAIDLAAPDRLAGWLAGLWQPAADLVGRLAPAPAVEWHRAVAGTNAGSYLLLGLAGLVIQFALTPNAYSLHRFYRDRLSKAFLFDTRRDEGAIDPAPLDKLRLSELAGSTGPYHLITAALNVQGSKEANRRGRNADFFLFSPRFVGSDLTFFGATGAAGMAGVLDMEQADPRLDLATAMAISGAAISANMGSSTLRLMSPTLALLNVRLGYWLPNPRYVAQKGGMRQAIAGLFRGVLEDLFLLREMLNLLTETDRELLLTDGGHIENLGIYELLKRGCRLIVAVDAEADPTLSFGSLLKLERYARIDLGVRIVLPWEQVAELSRASVADVLAGNRNCRFGPHCAVGRIIYEGGETGILLYFKATLTGDEKDYILDYKKRHPEFPHENTGDQFFTEEQFEMYRSLGFHMVAGFADGSDAFACDTRRRVDADPEALRRLILSWLRGT